MDQKPSTSQREALEMLIKEYYEKMMRYRPDAEEAAQEPAMPSMPPKTQEPAMPSMPPKAQKQDMPQRAPTAQYAEPEEEYDFDSITEEDQPISPDNGEDGLPPFFDEWKTDDTFSLPLKKPSPMAAPPSKQPRNTAFLSMVGEEMAAEIAEKFAAALFDLKLGAVAGVLDSIARIDPMLRKMVEDKLRGVPRK